MNDHRKRSRVTKALADGGLVSSFAEAEQLLDAVRAQILVGDDQVGTAAGQAAILTAVATAYKCFGRVALCTNRDERLVARLPIGKTLITAARRLGASIGAPRQATHTIRIGNAGPVSDWSVSCWWDRWLAGTRASHGEEPGDSRLPLAGIFAGAAAVQQIFACVLAGANVRVHDLTVSLWKPWHRAALSETGPERFDAPDKLWLIGLGHIGQGIVWALTHVGTGDGCTAILQDDQTVGTENEATSLCVLASGRQIGRKKVRVAAAWLECCGWTTDLIERCHHGDVAMARADPPILLSGLDRAEPRRLLATHGFAYMIDAGIGHTHGDFDGIQLRTVVKGQPAEGLWDDAPSEGDLRERKNLEKPAYAALDQCGRVGLAQASVAVPFVGAASGALVVAQAIRLASMEATPVLLQLQLSSADMPSFAGLIQTPMSNLGSVSIAL